MNDTQHRKATSATEQYSDALYALIDADAGPEARRLFDNELLNVLLIRATPDVGRDAINLALSRLDDARAQGFCDHCGTVPIATGRHVWGCKHLLARVSATSTPPARSHIMDRDTAPRLPHQRTAAEDFLAAHTGIPVAPAASWLQSPDSTIADRRAQLHRDRSWWRRITGWLR